MFCSKLQIIPYTRLHTRTWQEEERTRKKKKAITDGHPLGSEKILLLLYLYEIDFQACVVH